MSIARMKKIRITGHDSVRDDVIDFLHKQGVVQVDDLRQEVEDERYFENGREKKKTGEDKVIKITYIIKFLERFGMKTSMLKVMSEGKQVVTKSRLNEVIDNIDLDDFYGKCRGIEKSLREIDKNRARAYEHIEQLKPWVNLRVKLAELKDTVRARVRTGTVTLKNCDEFLAELGSNRGVEAGEVSRDNKLSYVFLVYLKEIDNSVNELLKKFEFNQVLLQSEDFEPQGLINQTENTIKKYNKEEEGFTEKAEGLTSNRQYLNILYDHYINLSDRENINDYLAGTSRSFLLSGWIEEKKADKTRNELEKEFREIEVSLTGPGKDEKVPIVFNNGSLVKPLEFVTDLYGRPVYSGIDPTPYFTWFFLVFFAICITDAGYGIMLSLASLFVLKKYKMGPKGTGFWKMGLYGGIATIIAGALTGGWFGNTIDIIPGLQAVKNIKNSLMIIDPIKSSQTFLYFSLALGYIQVLFGIAVKFYMDIRDRDMGGALFDELPWFLVLLCAPMIVIPGLSRFGTVLAVVCLLVVLLFYGRKSKNIFGRFASGAYRIYGGIDYMKDILSYSRLFALGLGTGIMAMAINSMIQMIPSGSIAGIILIPLIFIGGHTFNFVMNLLSGYIHTSRLQYIEFFTKFYESGGIEFKPFVEKRKFTEAS